jgi:hypothetical protein
LFVVDIKIPIDCEWLSYCMHTDRVLTSYNNYIIIIYKFIHATDSLI